MSALSDIPGLGLEVPVEILVLGVVTGLTYALLGIGLALVYRSTRIINLAHGEIGAFPALLVPILVLNHGLSYWIAVPAAIATSAALGALVELGVIRRLAHTSRLTVLVATIGVAQLLFVLSAVFPGSQHLAGQAYPVPFEAAVTIGTLRLNTGALLILAFVPLIVLGLHLFLRSSKLGRASRAASENTEAAQLAGVRTSRVSLAIWSIAGLLAGLSAILMGPTRVIATDDALGPELLLRTLGAAMIGGLTNLPQVFAGGIAIGVLEALISWNYPAGGVLELILFLVILVSLLARRNLGQGLIAGEAGNWSLTGSVRALAPAVARLPVVRAARIGGLAVLGAVAITGPLFLTTSERFLLSTVVLFAIMGLSLVVLTGFAGQVSLGQFAFVALGALVGGRLHQLGFPDWMALLYAIGAGGAVALLIGLPALRLRGLFLAVTTLGFAIATSSWLFNQPWLVAQVEGTTSLRIPRPVWLGIDLANDLHYYWLCLLVLAVSAALVSHLRRTGIGRAMLAVRDNEPAAAGMSLSPRRVKMIAFALSGMLASTAGYFYGGLLVNFADSPARSIFAPEESLTLVAMVVFGGASSVTGALLGAGWVQGIPHFFGSTIGILSSGIGILLVLLIIPGGLASVFFRLRDRVVAWLTSPTASEGEQDEERAGAAPADAADALPGFAAAPPVGSVSSPSTNGVPAIEASDIVVQFGGNRAVDGVSMHAQPGEIVGLMGPNGAGKTTLFNALTGQVMPRAGTVRLSGSNVTHLPPQLRAELGIGRTFQQARLFDELTVLESLKVALERKEPSELVPSLLALPPSRAAERRKEHRAAELIELLGLQEVGNHQITELPTGLRRRVELACVIAMEADVLLLDEPTAGFSQREVEAFRPVLRQARDYLDATIVVIDHDVPMMRELVDRMYVLASGQVISEGPPTILEQDPRIKAAYLGTNEDAINRSGAASASTASSLLASRGV